MSRPAWGLKQAKQQSEFFMLQAEPGLVEKYPVKQHR